MLPLGAWLALAAVLTVAQVGAVAPIRCPWLPSEPNVKRFALTASTFKSQLQTLAYNASAVGPLIRVKKGDLIQVDVTNKDIQGGTTVHWHGQDLLGAAWADGVAGVSQNPIPVGATFSYRFKAYPGGTYWYHSHTGEQFGDGLRGPLIVEDPEDPHRALYDLDLDEHILMLADVFDTTVEQQLQELQKGGMGAMGGGMGGGMGGMGGANPNSCPKLDQDVSDAPYYGVQVNAKGFVKAPGAAKASGAPLVVSVRAGKRYRFRVIAGMSSWALKVNVSGHPVDIIALDGRPVRPARAGAFLLTAGERLDFVLAADRPVGNYWIDVSTIPGQNSPAILHYEGAPDPLADPKFIATFKPNLGCKSGMGGQAGFVDLKNATLAAAKGVQSPPQVASKAYTIYLADAAATVAPPKLLSTLKKSAGPASAGLAPQGAAADGSASCPPLADGSPSKYCWSMNWNVYQPAITPSIFPGSMLTNRTYNIDLQQGDVIDLLLVNPSRMVHPMHLHGSGFWVLQTGNGPPLSADGTFDRSKAKPDLVNPIVRDTMPVAQATGEDGDARGYGYALVRIKADNVGPWAYHCHIELHASSGMLMTITVRPPGRKGAAWALPQGLDCKAAAPMAKESPIGAAPPPMERVAPMGAAPPPMERVAPMGAAPPPMERVAPMGAAPPPMERVAPMAGMN